MAGLTPDYSKRDCSLPPGCKDLIDFLNLKRPIAKPSPQRERPTESPVKRSVVALPPTILVEDLAQLLQMKPFMIIANLMEYGVFANLGQSLDFNTAARLLADHGVTPKSAP